MNGFSPQFRTFRSGLFLCALVFFLTSCHSPKLWGLSRDELFGKLETGGSSALGPVDETVVADALSFAPEATWCLGLYLERAGRTAESRAMFLSGFEKSPEPYRSLCADSLARTGSGKERIASIDAILSSPDPVLPSILAPSFLQGMKTSLALSLGDYQSVFGNDPVILAVRSAVWRKSWKEAWLSARPVFESAASGARDAEWNTAVFRSRAVLSDFCKAALYGSPKPASAAPLFDSLARSALKAGSRETAYILTFYAGRLYGRDSPESRDRFASALALADDDADHDNALWYLYDAAQASGSFLAEFSRRASAWKNPEYFNDILEPFIVACAHDSDWKSLSDLRAALPPEADSDIRARLDWLFARSGLAGPEEAEAALRSAFDADHSSLYYRVMAAEALGVDPGSEESFVAGIRRKATSPAADPLKEGALRALVDWGLEDRVYPVAARLYPDCSPDFARSLARALTAKGLYDDAIRIVVMAVHSSDAPITREDLEYMYPRPWQAEVSAAASRFGIPEYLLYALIRSESYFSPGAASAVGARGLTQLMGPTALDIARKLKIGQYDLSDPGTNILFGACYLSELVARLDGDAMSALYAYNAGITRVREWKKNAPGGDLFLEGLPYSETREYGRKVLAAAAVYGYLYYQKTTGQVVRELF